MVNTVKTARIVNLSEEGEWTTTVCQLDELQATMLSIGAEMTGLNRSPHNRSELQGKPRFIGFCGPMWDGDALRYENVAAYNTLSV